MEVKSVLIDTNAYAEFKKGNPDAVNVIRKIKKIIITPIVLGELLAGFVLGTRENKNREELKKFLQSKRVSSINVDNNTSEQFAKVYKELKAKGKPIPTNDMWILSLAKQHNLAIFSYDKHFNSIENIVIIKSVDNL